MVHMAMWRRVYILSHIFKCHIINSLIVANMAVMAQGPTELCITGHFRFDLSVILPV